MRIRVMTFNMDNLFQGLTPGLEAEIAGRFVAPGDTASSHQALLTEAVALMMEDEKRGLAAQAIRAGRPDIVLLQEVAGSAALQQFHDCYLMRLGGPELPHRAVLEGNDARGICVGVMSRLPIDAVASHRHLTLGALLDGGFRFEDHGIRHNSVMHDHLYSDPSSRIFRRDCLEIRLEIEGNPLIVFTVHFKAGLPSRAHTLMTRLAESAGVAELIRTRAMARGLDRWIVAGDLNDFHHIEGKPDEAHALGPLLSSGLVVDPMERLDPPEDRWTHFDWEHQVYRQLDYLLLSPELAATNPGAKPEVIRGGQPWRAERVREQRFPRVGWDRPNASDHCPVVIELEV